MPGRVARDVDDLRDLLGRHRLRHDVEGLDGLGVPADRRAVDVAAPLVVGDRQRLVVGRRPAEVHLEAGRASAAGVTVGVEHLAQGVERLVDRHEAVGPRGVPGGRRGGDGRPDQGRHGIRERPQAGAVHGDQAVVVDLLPAEQAADDVDALDQPRVPDVLARPGLAGDAFVAGLTGAERSPEAPGEHARQRRDGLGGDGRVVALPGGRDHTEREVGRGEGGTEEGPGEAGLPLSLRPR